MSRIRAGYLRRPKQTGSALGTEPPACEPRGAGGQKKSVGTSESVSMAKEKMYCRESMPSPSLLIMAPRLFEPGKQDRRRSPTAPRLPQCPEPLTAPTAPD